MPKLNQSKRHVFINCGAGRGDFVRWFLSTPIGRLYDWEVYAFDPLTYKDTGDVVIDHRAVWIKDGTVDFYEASNLESSTVCANKTSGAPFKPPIKVPCFNFSSWLLGEFGPKDFVILAMNIEGAEYIVLSDMLAAGAFANINRLYIEFHNTKVGFSSLCDLNLVRAIEALGVPVEPRCLTYPSKEGFLTNS